jgi:hypothetical protein
VNPEHTQTTAAADAAASNGSTSSTCSTGSTGSSDASKPVDEWVTGDEPATGPQRSYLETLAREAGEEVPEQLTKAQASELIDRLQDQSSRVSGSDATG